MTGRPTTLNGHPIKVRACRTLDRAYMYSTSPIVFSGEVSRKHAALADAVKPFRWSGDCYAYRLLPFIWGGMSL